MIHTTRHGELFHLTQYGQLAEMLEDGDIHLFREWFLQLVAYAESKWKRPESIFQHVLKYFADAIKETHNGSS